jgi:hypothetical protein
LSSLFLAILISTWTFMRLHGLLLRHQPAARSNADPDEPLLPQ